MTDSLKNRLIKMLRWSEKYTKTDMVYFVSGNFWLSISKFIGTGGGVILTLVFANMLDQAVFGTYKYVISIATMAGALSLTGLSTSAMRAVSQGNTSIVREMFWINIKWSIPASILALFGSIYYLFKDNNILGLSLLFIAILGPFLNSFVFSKSLLLGLKKYKANTLYGIPRGLIPICSLIIAIFLTQNPIIIIGTYFISNFLSGYLIYWLSIRKYASNKKSSPEEIENVFSYGKHLSVLGTLSQIAGNIDQFILWHFVGPVQLAVYTFALAPIREIKGLSDNVVQLVFPKFAVKSTAEIKNTLPLRLLQSFLPSLLICIIYILFAPIIFEIFLPQYTSAVLPSQILALTLLFQPKGLIDIFLTSHGKVRERYIYTISSTLFRLLSIIILIPIFNFWGAIIALILSDFFSMLVLILLYRKI